MDSKSVDRWIWLGLGLASLIAARALLLKPQQPATTTPVKDNYTRPGMLDRHTEDALKLDTLCQLAEGSSYDLRVAALKIICERSATGPAFSLLLQNVSSPDPQTRADALVALSFLCTSPSFPRIVTYPTFHAVVTALENILKEPYRTSGPQRPAPERHALFILRALLAQDINLALKAGIVKRWLARYPFGSTEAQTYEAIRKLRSPYSDDRALTEIISTLENHPEGRKQMRRAGLTGSSIGESGDEGERRMEGDWTVETAELITSPRRPREETAEEQLLRRRRREAVVVSDGGQPLGREDIIQREATGGRDEAEADSRRLTDQANRDDENAHVPGWRSWIPWR